MQEVFKEYHFDFLNKNIQQKVAIIANNSHQYAKQDNLKLLFSLIDLTSLNSEDNCSNIKELVLKVNSFNESFPEIPNVAAICVYPSLVACVKNNLSPKNIEIASVAGGFPSSQTFLEVKIEECKQAIEAGATEIDIVLSIGKFIEEDFEFCYNEIKAIKAAIGSTHLKVILETGALKNYTQIWQASILAMEAGADFIKTSTGKQTPAATIDAAYIMTKAIRAFYEKTGKKIGFKPAGGIVEAEEALAYYAIVKENLGDDWLNSRLFRIGASRLANNLLSLIFPNSTVYF